MSLYTFGYSSELLKIREYQDLKDMIKSQGKLAQITNSKLKEDFEKKIRKLIRRSRKSTRRKNICKHSKSRINRTVSR